MLEFIHRRDLPTIKEILVFEANLVLVCVV
jgi:hypothetical protein